MLGGWLRGRGLERASHPSCSPVPLPPSPARSSDRLCRAPTAPFRSSRAPPPALLSVRARARSLRRPRSPSPRSWFQDKDDVNWKKGAVKWRTLEHAGVLFPPAYEPHGAQFRYAGKPVPLTAEQEECATWYAAMKDTDYGQDPKFQQNFFEDWRNVLKKSAEGKAVLDFAKCDFSSIAAHVKAEDAKRKERSKEDKEADRKAKLAEEERFQYAIVDGRKEKVGNFRVEPPGLFRGRGEHPKRGRMKERIMPEDITINLGKGVPVPPVPDMGDGKAHRWGAVVSDSKVTWLAKWKDTINGQDKCVWLAANSAWKGMSDMAKYNKARALKDHIERVRLDYNKGMRDKALKMQQRSVAVYLIDQLALRVGNEKNTEEEADTVGCCSLRVEHVTLHDESKLELHFLGKDSIEFHQTVEVTPLVHELIKNFCHKKRPGDNLFDQIAPQELNAYFSDVMPGLTAKVSCARARSASRACAKRCTALRPSPDAPLRRPRAPLPRLRAFLRLAARPRRCSAHTTRPSRWTSCSRARPSASRRSRSRRRGARPRCTTSTRWPTRRWPSCATTRGRRPKTSTSRSASAGLS